MSENKKVKNALLTSRIITACIILVLGVLFCLQLANNVVSVILGAGLSVYALVGLISLAIRHRTLLSVNGIYNSIILAIGIVFIAKKLLNVFIGIIPYILVVVGIVIIIDALLGKFQRKSLNNIYMVIELILGILCTVFGLCLMFIEGFASATSIIFGIFLIVTAIFDIATAIIQNNKK